MKKYIYLASICLAAIFTSCEDFLSVKSPDLLTSGSFWRNQKDAEAGISAAYSQLEYSIDTWEFAEVKWPVEAYREDVVELGSDALNYPNWVDLGKFTYTNGNSQFSSYWWNNYKGINFSNQVIEKVGSMTDDKIGATVRTQIVNEAKFLRAYYHMKLLLNWNQIVVRDKYITKQADLNKALSSREAAWDFIVEDYKAATALPAAHDLSNIGRATRGAAYAYLGFCYLTRSYEEPARKVEYLTLALNAFNEVKGYDLEKNYLSMFDATNKNCKESVFELQYAISTANGANYRNQLHRWIGVGELWGWDEILPSQFLMTEYQKEGTIATTGLYDTRLYKSVFFKCDYFNTGNRVYGKNYGDWFDALDKPAFRKFMPATVEGLALNNSAINIPLMRYANVLLMKAEVLNEQNLPALAIPLINQVRDVHGDMPAMTGTSKASVQAQIEHERIIEFALENWRWYDLRRWGKLQQAMQAAGRTNFSVEKHAFYPVPLTELNANSELK